MASFLCNDTVREILSYLNLEDAKRFKSVCKAWHKLMSEPSFQSLQSRRSHVHVLGFFHKSLWDGPFTLVLHHPTAANQSTTNSTVSKILGSYMIVVAVCNGLVLVTNRRIGSYYLCNPSTGNFEKIPCLPSPNAFRHSSLRYGLATDSNSSYKIVVMVSCSSAYGFVYSSTTGSWKRFWEKIPGLPSGLKFCNYDQGLHQALNLVGAACARQTLHWLVGSANAMIVAYDLVEQQFRLMDLPSSDINIKNLRGPYQNVWFGSVGNCLYLLYVHESEMLQLWILEDYDNVKWKLVLEVKCSIMDAPVYFDGRRIGIAKLGEWEADKAKRPISFFDIHSREWKKRYMLPSHSHACQYFFPFIKDMQLLPNIV